MSKINKIVLAMGLVAFAAACGQQEEEVVVMAPEPITMEPVHTGKYK